MSSPIKKDSPESPASPRGTSPVAPVSENNALQSAEEIITALRTATLAAAERRSGREKYEKQAIDRAGDLEELNRQLVFQNEEKEKRAAELLTANKELNFQNEEKEKRAAELVIANRELAFQNEEKEKRAAELLTANKELNFQNEEKEKRAAELVIANRELAFQNEEKEKRAAELIAANKELQVFAYISSHDLQEPLRKIQLFAAILLHNEVDHLTPNGRDQLTRMQLAARQMRTLIVALQVYSHINLQQQNFAITRLNPIVDEIIEELSGEITAKKAVIHTGDLGEARINAHQFKQVLWHLADNALKFSREGVEPEIDISSRIANGRMLQKENRLLERGKLSAAGLYYHLRFADKGIGFETRYREKIFEVFQRLHLKSAHKGTGIGLPIVKKIVDNHGGCITATGKPMSGAIFDIYIPA